MAVEGGYEEQERQKPRRAAPSPAVVQRLGVDVLEVDMLFT
jgi:hypothetical protein